MTGPGVTLRATIRELVSGGRRVPLGHLPRRYRLLLMLYADGRELTLPEIAEIVGLPEWQVAEDLGMAIDVARRAGVMIVGDPDGPPPAGRLGR